MKTTITFVLALLITAISFAQIGFNYKALIKDSNGNVVNNQDIDMKFTIQYDGGEFGIITVYEESHTATTDANGIVIVNIGEGTTISGSFPQSNWRNSNFLVTKIDLEQDGSFVNFGNSDFKKVPMAIHANLADVATTAITATTANNVTGLQTITEGLYTGWRLIGRDPENYGNIGRNAVDLSVSTLTNNFRGATGEYSSALGFNTMASGPESFALGSYTEASGYGSMAFGTSTMSSGSYSLSMGLLNEAIGNSSIAFGVFTKAESNLTTVMGRYNLGGGNPTSWVATDPLFEIGNGTNNSNKNNALTVLKNGNTFIGGSLNINEDIPSGVALRVNGAEVIWFNGTYFSYGHGGSTNYFSHNVGIGLGPNAINPNAELDVIGNIEYTGTITDVSDRRLKENFELIENPLEKIKQITGLTYNMIDDESKKREYGVIAQDVQKVFPEMVSIVDTENGYLGVSYVQLIPVLLEAIKEQQTEINALEKKLTDKDASMATMNYRLEQIELLLKIDQ